MGKKSTQMGLRVWFLLIVVLLLHPTVKAQDPPVDDDQCLAYAYTESERLNFLLRDNSSMFGTTLKIIHNCQEVSIYVDGFFLASSSNDFSTIIEPGLKNITLEADNQTFNYRNVNFYPERLKTQYQYEINLDQENRQFIDLEVSYSRTNYAVGVGIFMVWVLTTYVYWSLISAYVDRNFIEEVVQ
jgi:hypothetical protein